MGAVRDKLRSFIAERYPTAAIEDDDDIFELGFINSLFAMEIVLFIESSYEIVIPTEDLTRENFSTVASMANLVVKSTECSGDRSA
jgi:methoxymalonate biosynthesis acyl carrier protein